ncbi:MAG TPA: periplasmic heavy metal sensor [Terracidiphilus sp.]|nr:periplasmic heavy metal sensor [Terracidiphilus sp.]
MKLKSLVRMSLALAALVATGLVGTAQAQRVGPGFDHSRPPMERMLGPRSPHGHWWNNPTMVEKLKLTDEQRKAMDDILLQHREKLIDLRANLEKAELVLKPMMSQDQPNEAGILAQIDKIATARADLEKANARFLLAIRAKLTADQWKTLQADWASRRHNRGWDRGHRGMRGHGMMAPPSSPNPPNPPSPPADTNQ